MTHDDRNRELDIERFFDGELAETDRQRVLDRLANDPEGRRHLDRLALLRDLAERHDPASKIPRRAIALSTARSRAAWWLAAASIAAAVALIFWPRSGGRDAPRVEIVERSGRNLPLRSVPAAVRADGLPIDRPPLEVELYGWANTPSRAPGQAARLVLSPVSPVKKRSSANEILAIELANDSPRAAGNVRRFAVSRSSRTTTPPRSSTPNPRPKTVQPDV